MNICQRLELIQVRNKIGHSDNIEIRREQSVYMVGYFCLLSNLLKPLDLWLQSVARSAVPPPQPPPSKISVPALLAATVSSIEALS